MSISRQIPIFASIVFLSLGGSARAQEQVSNYGGFGAFSGSFVGGLTQQTSYGTSDVYAQVTHSTDPFNRNQIGAWYTFSDPLHTNQDIGWFDGGTGATLSYYGANPPTFAQQQVAPNGFAGPQSVEGFLYSPSNITGVTTLQVVGAAPVTASNLSNGINIGSVSNGNLDVSIGAYELASRGLVNYFGFGIQAASLFTDVAQLNGSLYANGQLIDTLAGNGALWHPGETGGFGVSASDDLQVNLSNFTGPITFDFQGYVQWYGYGSDTSTYFGQQAIDGSQFDDSFTYTPSGSPEPFTIGLGVAGVGLAVRRRFKAAK